MVRRLGVLCFGVFAFASAGFAWERLVTVDGRTIEGDISQPEFIFIEDDGSEVSIPRAALSAFERSESGFLAHIKDGTTLQGALQGKLEIEDGLIRRRYSGDEIAHIEFDRFIELSTGKNYHSCPIRIELDVTDVLLGENPQTSSALPRTVNCNELRIATATLKRSGRIRPSKPTMITLQLDFDISVPHGKNQLLDVAIQLVQGDLVVARASRRFAADAEGISTASLSTVFASQKIEPEGPKPRLRVQVVSQNSEREVEKGSLFWWFTIPLPLG